MFAYGPLFIVSLLLGSLSRAFMLRIDYRQFPSYPHSYAIHLTIGIIASTLGALIVPVLLEKEYIAVTFLTLAAQQFREVRSIERDSLNSIEKTEIVPRGEAYIEGMAKLFEARNYLSLITSLITSLLFFYLGLFIAIIGGVVAAALLHIFMKSPTISDIAKIKIAPLNIDNKNIGIDNLVIMNIGENEALEKWQKEGIGIKIIPKDENARATLFNSGQRQVILHDLSILMGVKLDEGLQHFTPLARIDIDYGTLNIIFLPQEPDKEFIKEAVGKIPVLESSQRKPLKSSSGKKAAD